MSDGKLNVLSPLVLKPGTLWTKVIQRTEAALGCGALRSIPTECFFVEQDGIAFLVRIISNLQRKDEAQQKQQQKTAAGKEFNPFLPYEQNLFVADISQTHLCLLNKFNVVNYHLLIVTRHFEDQDMLLTGTDFEAMWACLREYDGLAFYNGGQVAGASQRHKHLQLVPLPLAATGSQIPIAPLLPRATSLPRENIGQIPGLPFRHAFVRFSDQMMTSDLRTAADTTLELYRQLLTTVGLLGSRTHHSSLLQCQEGPYNLLVTREWMLLVPRSQEHFHSISINSLGFAGALLVRNQEQMQVLQECGPMNVLRHVAISD
ncbi:MAG TPA: phosphorylase [Oscillatoriaceae cyanobacterium M33_DOE_052]|uniref:Phosphorylase n=1 Tax=Planktothricoides sp. SpSt-374 TaxID=2282167 RepID=A0A7C3VGL8_9CYAN|nr:phosphorylase [Oscillatoriaceae cyanobacterium M33_DOE_052]